jgi:signal transduction histidine kinase/CheY-like chemotaxis protein
LIWGGALYEIDRARESRLSEIDAAAVFQAQAFAENSLSAFKRLNEVLLDLRDYWDGNPQRFAELVRRRQAYLDDIAFQVAVIDRDGYMVFSNLAAPKERLYLGERKHFLVHRDSGADRLYISSPVKGKVSGKWSIQFTRPILEKGKFAGVLVLSVPPAALANFNDRLNLEEAAVSAMVRSDGEVMARQPDNDAHMGKFVTDAPYMGDDAPQSGNYARVAQLDGIERRYGFYSLPEYGMVFVVGHATEQVLGPYRDHREAVLMGSGAISVIVVLLLGLLFRTLEQRQHAERRLSDSQAMLRSAVDTIGEGFVIYDEKDRLAYFNDEYIGCYSKSADLLVPGASFEDIVREGVKRGQYRDAIGREDEWVAERLAIHRSGDTDMTQQLDDGRWMRIRERRTPEGFIVGFRIDVTELFLAKEAAEAANEAKSRFLATMSHEIRTPMNGILGMAQLLLQNGLNEQERRDYVRTILTSGQGLLSLLNDILDLSKIEAGKLEMSQAVFSPSQLLDETVKLFSGSAVAKGLGLSATWNGPAGYAYRGDPMRLRQMLSNLVSNAIKFTSVGSVQITATEVTAREGGAQLEFAVADSGIGIAEEKQALLFLPFSQADSSTTREFGGTGLGLSIVRKLAELMGGEVGVESRRGEGARFWFRVRVERLARGSEMRATERPAPAAGKAWGEGREVLVVEDHPINRRVIEAMLTRQGLHVTCVENGAAALERLAEGPTPDLVLMDVQMPVMDGLTAVAELRRRERENGCQHLTVVALTAGAFTEDREKCFAAGMDDFLAKPLDQVELLAILDKWLSTAEA